MSAPETLRQAVAADDLTEVVDLLDRLVSIDTPSGDAHSLGRAMDVITHELSRRGFTVATRQDEHGAPVLVADRGSGAGFGLVGHIDTVFGAGEAERRPFAVEGGIATGPGVADMKGGIVTLIRCVDLLDRVGGAPALRIVINGDEERGSPGSRRVLVEALRQVEAALVFEPGRPGGEFVNARRGTVRALMRVEGVAAHSGVAPRDGANAIHDLAGRIVSTARIGEELPGCDVNVNLIAGGTGINTIPALAEAEIDARTTSMIDDREVRRRIDDVVARAGVPRTRCSVEWLASRPPLERHPRQDGLIGRLTANGEAMGIPVRFVATGGGSDGNLLAAEGIAVIDGCGGVGGHYHRADEFVRLDSIVERAAVCAAALCDTRGGWRGA